MFPCLAAIFQASIEELTEEDYDAGQRAAWAGQADDEVAFGAKLVACLTLVATLQGAPVGFVALEDNRHVEMLYVYPPVARRGVATLLCDALETLAQARGTKALSVDASDNARPFFEAARLRGAPPADRFARRPVARQHAHGEGARRIAAALRWREARRLADAAGAITWTIVCVHR